MIWIIESECGLQSHPSKFFGRWNKQRGGMPIILNQKVNGLLWVATKRGKYFEGTVKLQIGGPEHKKKKEHLRQLFFLLLFTGWIFKSNGYLII